MGKNALLLSLALASLPLHAQSVRGALECKFTGTDFVRNPGFEIGHVSVSANRSFSRNSDHTVKVNKPKKK